MITLYSPIACTGDFYTIFPAKIRSNLPLNVQPITSEDFYILDVIRRAELEKCLLVI